MELFYGNMYRRFLGWETLAVGTVAIGEGGCGKTRWLSISEVVTVKFLV
ncbi:MAG: hypothetical protein HYT39_02680 [Candidatus Sungbacteria bacterium]|nr:hypothetical protein [Candidatus Sungbacteria bacterium]